MRCEHAEIVYYENQKANAIAPRVTDKAASTVLKQIDETFAETISEVGLATASSLLEFMDGDQVANYAANLSATLDAGIATLRDASQTASDFTGILGSSTGLLDSAGDLLDRAGETTSGAEALAGDVKTGLANMDAALDGAVSSINDALADSAGDYEAAATAIEKAFGAVDDHVATSVGQLRGAASKISAQAEKPVRHQTNIEPLRTRSRA